MTPADYIIVTVVLLGFALWQLLKGGGPTRDGPDNSYGSDGTWPF